MTRFPQSTHADVSVVVVVVVDVEAARGEAPNNHARDLYRYPSLAPGPGILFSVGPLLVFYPETKAIKTPSHQVIGTKFCVDARYHGP